MDKLYLQKLHHFEPSIVAKRRKQRGYPTGVETVNEANVEHLLNGSHCCYQV